MTTTDKIEAIPAWRRFLICTILRRRQWNVCRAYNTIAIHAIHVLGDHALFEDMKRRGDKEWATLYRV